MTKLVDDEMLIDDRIFFPISKPQLKKEDLKEMKAQLRKGKIACRVIKIKKNKKTAYVLYREKTGIKDPKTGAYLKDENGRYV